MVDSCHLKRQYVVYMWSIYVFAVCEIDYLHAKNEVINQMETGNWLNTPAKILLFTNNSRNICAIPYPQNCFVKSKTPTTDRPPRTCLFCRFT